MAPVQWPTAEEGRNRSLVHSACVCVRVCGERERRRPFLAVSSAPQRVSSKRRMMREIEEMKVKRSERCKK